MQNLDQRIEDLESKLAFQDDLLHTLNEIISKQEMEIQKLWSANQILRKNFEELKHESGTAPAADQPPPHY